MERHQQRRADAQLHPFSQAIDEVVDARVWSGIHSRAADEQGERIGAKVARFRKGLDFRATTSR